MTNNHGNRQVDIVLGAQLGDEGKGRLIDFLAAGNEYNIVARCNSGGNAGHKVVVDGFTYAFHMVPSGILNPNVKAVIGNGCVVNLEDLKTEIEAIQSVNPKNPATRNITTRLYISNRAHIVLPQHKTADGIREQLKTGKANGSPVSNNQSIGTTRQGMGPVYATKALRVGLRMCDLLLPEIQLSKKVQLLLDELSLLPDIDNSFQVVKNIITKLKEYARYYEPMILDTVFYLNGEIQKGKRILVEGAQATLLDNDFGVYPYCIATTCTIGAISTGLGIPPHHIGMVNYVMKTYTTRVGNGPFPTEQVNSVGEQLQTLGHEYGTTTGRRRRCGWLDIPMIKWSLMVNGTANARICLTKLDVLDTFPKIKIATKYFVPSADDGNYDMDILEELKTFPASLENLAQVHVVYETLDGWMTPTTGIRKWKDLPPQAQTYIKRIESLLGVSVYWIGIGADRDAIICNQ
jgi:adenylosuccinate synthase